MSEAQALVVLSYHGQDVAFDPATQMWNLNAMHRAAGGDAGKAPAHWLRGQQPQELIAALGRRLNYTNLYSLVETREGRNGGTWAHWQIAAAYAHWLNPDFYLEWNEWALAYSQQGGQARRLAEFGSPYAHFVRALDTFGGDVGERAQALGITTRTLHRYRAGTLPNVRWLVRHPALFRALMADAEELRRRGDTSDAARQLAEKLLDLLTFATAFDAAKAQALRDWAALIGAEKS